MSTTETTAPMSRVDYLLSHLAQECCEVAVRATKAQHFGLSEVQPEQPYTNAERILHELCDLVAMVEVMQAEGVLPTLPQLERQRRVEEKKAKALRFSGYSRELGRLRD